MPNFTIMPKRGVGPVLLGMTRSEVRNSLVACSDLDQECGPMIDYAFANSLQIEYDSDGYARFIGVGYGNGCGCDYEFHGKHIGDYSARELFHLLAKLDGGEHTYNADTYFFPTLLMNVWEADVQYDSRGGETNPVYGQVGVSRNNHDDNNSETPS